MSNMYLTEDYVTLTLLVSFVLLVGLPGVIVLAWRLTSPPVQGGSLRWIYLAWALLLAASTVWNLAKDVRLSADEAGADNFVRLGFLALGCLFILFIGAKYRFALISEMSRGVLGIFFVFSLWGLASTLWSVLPTSTLYKSIEYSAMFALFALTISSILMNIRDPRSRLLAVKSIFDWNWFLVAMLLVSVYMGLIVFPEYAIVPGVGMLGFSISGAFPAISANGVGQHAAILGIVVFIRLLLKPKSRLLYAPILAVCLVTMVLTQSRTPILAFLVAAAVVLVASRRFGLLAFLSFSVSTVLLSAYGQTIFEFMRREQSEGNMQTLSGRTIYWQSSLEAVSESWINGYGANAGGKYVLQTLGEVGSSSVHSTWIETLLDTGVVGVALLLVGLTATWVGLFKVRSYAVASPVGRLIWFESLGVLVILSLRSVFTVTLVWTSAVLVLGLVLVFVSVMRRQRVQQHYAGAFLAQPVSASWRRRSGIRG